MTQGWKCPNCGRAHAPHVQTCPEPATAAPVYVPQYPPIFVDPPPRYDRPWPIVTRGDMLDILGDQTEGVSIGDAPGTVSVGTLDGLNGRTVC